MKDYLNSIEDRLTKLNIIESQLNLGSQTVLFNLQGLYDLANLYNSKYAKIYFRINQEKLSFKKINKKELILQFSPSERINHKIISNSNYIKIIPSFITQGLSETYFTYIAQYLFTKILRKQIPSNLKKEILLIENSIKKKVGIQQKIEKDEISYQGKYYNLKKIFTDLNVQYFNKKLSLPILRWSKRINYRRLGSFDSHRNLLTISRLLDSLNIPEYVIQGIIYHEMLHMQHPVQYGNSQRIIHNHDFKLDEKKFIDFSKLNKWLNEEHPKIVRKLK